MAASAPRWRWGGRPSRCCRSSGRRWRSRSPTARPTATSAGCSCAPRRPFCSDRSRWCGWWGWAGRWRPRCSWPAGSGCSGGVLLAASAVATPAAVRALHGLARRWLVFVPAGVVVHDLQTLGEAVLFPRTSVAALAVAEGDPPAGVLDLTRGTVGLALQLDLREPLPVSPRQGRRAVDLVDVGGCGSLRPAPVPSSRRPSGDGSGSSHRVGSLAGRWGTWPRPDRSTTSSPARSARPATATTCSRSRRCPTRTSTSGSTASRRSSASTPSLQTPDSPTQQVGAPLDEAFPPFTHLEPMQSLDNAFGEDRPPGLVRSGRSRPPRRGRGPVGGRAQDRRHRHQLRLPRRGAGGRGHAGHGRGGRDRHPAAPHARRRALPPGGRRPAGGDRGPRRGVLPDRAVRADERRADRARRGRLHEPAQRGLGGPAPEGPAQRRRPTVGDVDPRLRSRGGSGVHGLLGVPRLGPLSRPAGPRPVHRRRLDRRGLGAHPPLHGRAPLVRASRSTAWW